MTGLNDKKYDAEHSGDSECVRCGSVGGYGCYECIPDTSHTDAEPSHTLADAYSAGLEAAADKAESMPTGIYPKDVAKAIRAQKVPTEFGGE